MSRDDTVSLINKVVSELLRIGQLKWEGRRKTFPCLHSHSSIQRQIMIAWDIMQPHERKLSNQILEPSEKQRVRLDDGIKNGGHAGHMFRCTRFPGSYFVVEPPFRF